MGFLKPKVPEPPPAANPASAPLQAPGTKSDSGLAPVAASLVSTSVQGLKRRASTERTSLIGGA